MLQHVSSVPGSRAAEEKTAGLCRLGKRQIDRQRPERHPSSPELGIIRDPACRRLCRARHNRRTAVRNLERAGIPRQVAMAMVGHKTEAIYRRYAIVSASALRRAARQLDDAAGIPEGIVPATAARGTGSMSHFYEEK